MRAGSIGWHDEQDDEERRRVRKAISISIGIHVALFAALVISPPASLAPMPATISVELVAGPQIAPPAAPRPRGRAKPPPPAPEPPAPEAAPEPPPPPIAKAPVQVLPENAPKPDKKVQQAPEKKPKEVAKAEPKEPPAKAPEKDLSYEDAMKSLDEELGEDETEDLLVRTPARPNAQRAEESSGAARSSSGVQLSAEEAAWIVATRRLIQSKWVTPSNFRGRGLKTGMQLRLSATGEVLGEPKVTHPSEDPYFDDNAVRAVMSVSPLPVPPRAGTTTFIFSSEE